MVLTHNYVFYTHKGMFKKRRIEKLRWHPQPENQTPLFYLFIHFIIKAGPGGGSLL